MSSQRPKMSTSRDSIGSSNQRLVDLAYGKPGSSPGAAGSGSGSSSSAGLPGSAETSAKSSSGKESSSSRPSSPVSSSGTLTNLDISASANGIDIPNSNVGSNSGGENQSSVSVMSVVQSASSLPSSYYSSVAASAGTGMAHGHGSGSAGGGSSSSDTGTGAGTSPGPASAPPHQSTSSSAFTTSSSMRGEDASSKEDDSIKSEPTPLRAVVSTPDPMHPSQSEPVFLKPGDVPYVDFQTPTRDERSPKLGKKKPKSSPWYNVLAPTYKSKCEEFRRIFKTIPSNERLIMDYSCALQKDILVHGRMYITEGWLCFYANIFKWETMLTIRFKDVTAITKERTIRFIPNAIQISTDSEKYFFTSFMSREKSFMLLFKIWQNALLEQTMPSAEYWTWVHSNYGSDLGIQRQELPEDYVEPEMPEGLDPINGMNEDSTEEVSQSLGSEEHSLDEVFEGSKEEAQTDSGDVSAGITITVPSPNNKADPDLEADADEGEADPLSSVDFGGKELINEVFNIPVDKLFAALYGNQHPFTKKFLDHRKCTDLEFGDWTRLDSDRDTRKVNYIMHLNTSLGYKACGVEENHMFQKNWSKTGTSYIVEKEVYNKNVPYCDYFYVHTCHVLTRVTPTSSRLRFIMRIEFLKSALGLVKNFIERNVESGIKQGERELVKFIRDNLENAAPVKKRKGKKRRAQHPKKDGEEKRRVEVQSQPSTAQGFLGSLTPVWFQPNLDNKLSLHSTMAFISLILAILCVFNVSLFLQLKSLEESATNKNVWSNAEFVKRLSELPKTEKDWAILLQQQQQFHAKEMQKWKDIVDLCIQLIKQMETTLGELQEGISSAGILPNIQELLDAAVTETKPDNSRTRPKGTL